MPVEIRKAVAADADGIRAVIDEAYSPYIPRIGRRPSPMDADYPALIAAGAVEVALDAVGIAGAVVLLPQDDGALLLDNIAVADRVRGTGLGGRLIDRSESVAKARGCPLLRLYTHESMTENRAIYRKRGFAEARFVTEKGFARVYMEKRLDT